MIITEEEVLINAKADKYDCICTLTGGIDSTVLVHKLALMDEQTPLCVYIKYGSKAERAEILKASVTCEKLELDMVILDMEGLYKTLSSSFILGNTDEFETGSMFWLEGRNMLIGLMLAIYAAKLDLQQVNMGCNASDYGYNYPDSGIAAFQALNLMLTVSTKSGVQVFCDLLTEGYTKPEVIELGNELGVDWLTTHSCSSTDEDKPCCNYEVCESCKSRLADFAEAGMEDPFKPN